MLIIFDFDHTLFDTEQLKAALKDISIKHGVSDELFGRTLEESRGEGRDWKPKRQFAILRSLGVSSTDLIYKEFSRSLKNSYLFLYKDVIPFLEKARKNNSFALLTYGEDSFQKLKVSGCEAAIKYFKKVVITQNIYKDKEANDLSGGKDALFVEDNPIALAATKKYAPYITTVRMNRGVGRYANEVLKEGIDYEVKDLTGVERIILNYEL